MRALLAWGWIGLLAGSPPAVFASAGSPVAIEILELEAAAPSQVAVTQGSLDEHFRPLEPRASDRDTAFWLKLHVAEDIDAAGMPTLNLDKGRHLRFQLFAVGSDGVQELPMAAALPGFSGLDKAVYLLPRDPRLRRSLYAFAEPSGRGSAVLYASTSTLQETLSRGAAHARMIALSCGALMAMALAALLIWFMLSEKLLLLYATLFALQALYVSYLSGQGFEWPVLSYALPVISYTWNVCAALSGAVACLFVREIAELRLFSPRVYRLFGGLAVTFLVLAFANLAQYVGMGGVVAVVGNLIFLGAAATTLVVAFMAWRRRNRAAGWFLIAWGLLEAVTIVTAIHLLVSDVRTPSVALLYYGLPLSMVAAAVLIALGMADRLRDQRMALTDAEWRARTDPLTGVLNRRSLLERLESACFRARGQGLPVALLFLDLDHFKEINDTFGHPAGDACLKAIIGPIQSELRHSDVIGRYGGEEFIVILNGADLEAARPIAERIRNRIANVRVAGFGEPIGLTCSIGVATSELLGVWGEHLIARADEAVYAAKRSGRNRVQIAAPLAA